MFRGDQCREKIFYVNQCNFASSMENVLNFIEIQVSFRNFVKQPSLAVQKLK